MHHILYEDGENEWVSLPKEIHAWVPSLPGRPYPAGLAPGESATLHFSLTFLCTMLVYLHPSSAALPAERMTLTWECFRCTDYWGLAPPVMSCAITILANGLWQERLLCGSPRQPQVMRNH